jgi:hypothetical protein
MKKPLPNSRRVARMSSYTPVRFQGEAPAGSDVITTAALIRSLELLPAELGAIDEQVTSEDGRRAAAAIRALVEAGSSDQIQRATEALGSVPGKALVAAIDEVRAKRLATLAEAARALTPSSEPDSPGDEPRATTALSGAQIGANRWKSMLTSDLVTDLGATTSGVVTWRPRSIKTGGGTPPASLLQGILVDKTAVYAGWPGYVDFIKIVQPYVPPGTDVAMLDPLDALAELDRKSLACTIAIGALSRREVQPLGLLHLEALSMMPGAPERGELVFSLPLSPHEKVTLSHKEWSVRESEFTEFIQDSIENYSERGVAEVDEIAISSQHERRKTERTGVGASGGVTITGPADAGSTVVTETNSRQESVRHAQTITTQASSRSIRDHKVSFTVATVVGSEDFTSRLLENRFADRAMRIDYFRRMKPWRVSLYRTGVRLAYDIVIPDPGKRLRLRHDLVRGYDRALTATFDPGVRVDDISRTNWTEYSAAYGVVLGPPPADPDGSPGFGQWQVKSFSALRDAAYTRFTQVQEIIRQRRAEAARQIDAAADPDTLRRIEREEIQRLTLGWLVPGFLASAAAPSAPTEPQGLSDASWQQALEYGEYIKFVHSAIDWSRLAYFLYPYFWSDRQIERLFLRHPDPIHRDFLRAGAARVIVPIMPGFEEELTSFIDKGRIGQLPNGHRFGPAVSAVKAAHQQFAGGNGETWHDDDEDDDEDEENGGRTLIASWTEYTPTGALDLDVVTMPIQNE